MLYTIGWTIDLFFKALEKTNENIATQSGQKKQLKKETLKRQKKKMKNANNSMFHVTWTTFKFNRNQLGTVFSVCHDLHAME